jgi:hypothetical protein
VTRTIGLDHSSAVLSWLLQRNSAQQIAVTYQGHQNNSTRNSVWLVLWFAGWLSECTASCLAQTILYGPMYRVFSPQSMHFPFVWCAVHIHSDSLQPDNQPAKHIQHSSSKYSRPSLIRICYFETSQIRSPKLQLIKGYVGSAWVLRRSAKTLIGS